MVVENIEGSTGKLGDEWTYRNEDVHRCKLKVTELIPGKKVVWRVLDAQTRGTFTSTPACEI